MTADMVFVPGRTLSASSDQGDSIGRVQMSPFFIDRGPVTWRAFARFVDAGGYAESSFWTPSGWAYIAEHRISGPASAAPHFPDADEPVTGVCWWEALAYARYAGKALPTEAQWECAWRGVQDGGDAPGSGSLEGAYTAGALAEWCLDSYTAGRGFAGAAPDPVLLDDDDAGQRVVRGGGGAGCSRRDGFASWSRDPRIGFRCAYKTAQHAADGRAA